MKKPKYSTKTKALGKSFLFFIISIGICSSPEADKNLDNATDKVEKKKYSEYTPDGRFFTAKIKNITLEKTERNFKAHPKKYIFI